MNSMISRLASASKLQQYGLFVFIFVSVLFLGYEKFLSGQISLIDQHDDQLRKLYRQLKHYQDNAPAILSWKQTVERQTQQLSRFEQLLSEFNHYSPESTLLAAADKTHIDLKQLQISTLLEDQSGKYYHIEIKLKDNLITISQFLTTLLNLEEFAVWEYLNIDREDDTYRLTLAIRYYAELFDAVSG